MKPMKNILLLLLFAGSTLSSCRTAFPEAQTPDDVYYSPEGISREQERTETDEDRFLRMKVRNHRDWSTLNDWYTYERWSYGMNYSYGTPYHPYYNWNVYHNPYWLAPTGPRPINRPRISNLNTYQPDPTTASPKPNPVNPKLSGTGNTYTPKPSGSSNGTRTIGGGLRDVFGTSNPSSGNPSPSPTSGQSTAPATPSAPVRKF